MRHTRETPADTTINLQIRRLNPPQFPRSVFRKSERAAHIQNFANPPSETLPQADDKVPLKSRASFWSAIVGAAAHTNRVDQSSRSHRSMQSQKEFFDTLSSRIAAARSSSLVKNFGWSACMNLRSQSRQRRCSWCAFSESCCCLFFMTGYFYVMQPGAPCQVRGGETASNREKMPKIEQFV
jgi:hypothetical protein